MRITKLIGYVCCAACTAGCAISSMRVEVDHNDAGVGGKGNQAGTTGGANSSNPSIGGTSSGNSGTYTGGAQTSPGGASSQGGAGGIGATGGATVASSGLGGTGASLGGASNAGSSSVAGAGNTTGGTTPNGGANSTGGAGIPPNGGKTSTGGTTAAAGAAPMGTGGTKATTGGQGPVAGAAGVATTGGTNATVAGAGPTGGATAAPCTDCIVQAIAAGDDHTCATVNMAVQCWGYNYYGELGNNSTVSYSSSPVQVYRGLASATATGAGANHTCVVINGGVECWGYNSNGQLGNNSTANSHIPSSVVGLEPGPTSSVTAVAGGFLHSCAVVNNGVQCWGYNSAGELGNNSTNDSHTPVQVLGLTSGVTAVTANGGPMSAPSGSGGTFAYSGGHTCAVINGSVQCWGYNSYGQLGNNSTTNSHYPVQVVGLTGVVTAISNGFMHSCAVVNGAVQCWGSNSNGQLGTNSTANSSIPVQVMGLTAGATAVSCGGQHSCAVVDGSAYCWGYNSAGQLGDGSPNTPSSTPVQVKINGLYSGVTAISCGGHHSCAIVNDSAYCWGENFRGELGDGSTTRSNAPVKVQVQAP